MLSIDVNKWILKKTEFVFFENQKTVTKTGIKYFRSAKMDPGEIKLVSKPKIVLTVTIDVN